MDVVDTVVDTLATGLTYMDEIEYVERGYEDVVKKFRSLGADIEKIEE